MTKVLEIAKAIERLAPKQLAEPWDNVGLMIGDEQQYVDTVYLALDVTSGNVDEAIRSGAQLIVSHHPLLFSPLKSVTEQTVTGSIVRSLIQNNISVYSAHTNLDKAEGGMNDILCEKLGINDVRPYTPDECIDPNGSVLDNIGRIGILDTPTEMADFVDYVKNVLGCRAISYTGDLSDVVTTAAVCSGSGGDLIYNAYNAGADVYITSEIKHHEAQLALELGINLIDAGHFETENIVCDFMEDYLSLRFPDINFIKSSAKPYKLR